ncbi:MAG: vWA domain-containing protein [Nocardioidaceae bacterium]
MMRRDRGTFLRWAAPTVALGVVTALVLAEGGGGGAGAPADEAALRVRLVSVQRDGAGVVALGLHEGAAAAPGALVAVEGGDWRSGLERVSVGSTRSPVVAASRDRLVFVVPPVAPGPTRISVPVRGGSRSIGFRVLPVRHVPGPPGAGARRYLDLVGSLFDEVGGVCAIPGTCPGRSSRSWQRVVLVVDASTSMDEADMGLPRIDAAKATLRSLLDTVQRAAARASQHFGVDVSVEVGLVPFAAQPLALYGADLTKDLGFVHERLAEVQTDFGTAMGPAIEEALNMLGPDGGVMILLGDGADHGLELQTTPLEAARKAGRLGSVTIHTIGFGAPGHEDLDEALLRSIAETTGGGYHRAAGAEELRRAYDQIFLQALTAAVVTKHRDEAVAEAGPRAGRALSTLRPPHDGAGSSVAAARAALDGLGTATLRDLDGFIAASQVLDALTSAAGSPLRDAAVPVRPEGGSVASGGDLSACDDIDTRVGRILVEGAAELIGDVALPGWGAGVGWGADLALGMSSPLWFDLGQHLDDALALRAWGGRVIDASMLATGCIDAVGAALEPGP